MLSTFAKRVNDAFHGGIPVYKNHDTQVHKAWKDITTNDKQFERTFARMFADKKDNVVKEAVRAHAPSLIQPKSAVNGKGKGKGINDYYNNKGKGKGKGKAAGSAPNASTFVQQNLPDDMTLFYDPEGKPADIIKHSEMDWHSTGVALMSANQAQNLLREIGNQELANQPLAILIPPTDWDFFDRLEALPFTRKFRPTTIKELPTKKQLTDNSRCGNATMLQLGKEDISYDNPTIIHDLGVSHIVQRLSAQISADKVPSAVFKKLKDDPHDYIIKAIGADKLQPKRQIRKSRLFVVNNQDGTTTERIDCFVYPAADMYYQVMRRSGTNDVHIMTETHDNNTETINLKQDATNTNAVNLAKTLGNDALGVVRTSRGYAIRTLPETRATVEAQLFPEMAAQLGNLMSLRTNNADEFLIKGIPHTFDKEDVRATLEEAIGFKCKPLHPQRGTGSTKDWRVLVQLGTEPSKSTFMVMAQNLRFPIYVVKNEKTTKPTIFDEILEILTKGQNEDDAQDDPNDEDDPTDPPTYHRMDEDSPRQDDEDDTMWGSDFTYADATKAETERTGRFSAAAAKVRANRKDQPTAPTAAAPAPPTPKGTTAPAPAPATPAPKLAQVTPAADSGSASAADTSNADTTDIMRQMSDITATAQRQTRELKAATEKECKAIAESVASTARQLQQHDVSMNEFKQTLADLNTNQVRMQGQIGELKTMLDRILLQLGNIDQQNIALHQKQQSDEQPRQLLQQQQFDTAAAAEAVQVAEAAAAQAQRLKQLQEQQQQQQQQQLQQQADEQQQQQQNSGAPAASSQNNLTPEEQAHEAAVIAIALIALPKEGGKKLNQRERRALSQKNSAEASPKAQKIED